jgi:2-dehydro-3-deoxy-D-arabinonate dehydratase
MQLYKTREGALLQSQNKVFLLTENWDTIINRSNLHQYLSGLSQISEPLPFDRGQELLSKPLAPIGDQEVWAAGVTYLKSRDARMEESKESGASDVYSKVYDADRPELFFKALPHRVSVPGGVVYIRKDSTWNVPEPELTLYINSNGEIQAYTVGNDMSSRSIEGENPLYLPQAKVYELSCALGPCLYIPEQPISPETKISISIKRNHQEVFNGSIQLNRMKRNLPELAAWLFRACQFQQGCFLMTGTGIVPSSEFTLQANDEVSITIEGIGTLTNTVQVI